MHNIFAGADIGGTDIKMMFGLCDARNPLTHPTNGGIDGVLDQVSSDIIGRLSNGQVRSVGVGITGIVDTHSGRLIKSNNLGYDHPDGFPIVEEIQKRVGVKVPIFLYNDADCAAFAEAAIRRKSDLIMVTLGTSPGGGIIRDKKILGDHTNPVSEFGSIRHQKSGLTYRELLKRDYLAELLGIDPHSFRESLIDVDPMVLEQAIDTYTNHLLDLLIHLQQEHQMNSFVLGGGIMDMGTEENSYILEAISKKAITHSIRVHKARLGNSAGVIGSRMLARLATRDDEKLNYIGQGNSAIGFEIEIPWTDIGDESAVREHVSQLGQRSTEEIDGRRILEIKTSPLGQRSMHEIALGLSKLPGLAHQPSHLQVNFDMPYWIPMAYEHSSLRGEMREGFQLIFSVATLAYGTRDRISDPGLTALGESVFFLRNESVHNGDRVEFCGYEHSMLHHPEVLTHLDELLHTFYGYCSHMCIDIGHGTSERYSKKCISSWQIFRDASRGLLQEHEDFSRRSKLIRLLEDEVLGRKCRGLLVGNLPIKNLLLPEAMLAKA